MTSDDAPPRERASRRSRRRQRPRWRRIGRRVFTAAIVLVLVTVTYYVGLVAYADNRVQRVAALRPDGPEIVLPQQQRGAENYLIVGSDEGERDTVLLAHLSATGERALAVVFPRDVYVDVPACTGGDGEPSEPYGGAFGSVLPEVGAGCLVRTVQVLTGLRVDHYVQLDLAGFPAMVDALGGVPLCLDSPLTDPASGLDLPAGTTMLDGVQTLPFLRLESVRGAAETERIRRQQQFLGSVVDRSLAARTLVNPARLTGFARATSEALTLDPETTLRDLQRLVGLLSDLGSPGVPLLTAPIGDPDYPPTDGSPPYALLDEQRGRQLYLSIIEETALPVPPRGASPSAGGPRAVGAPRACG